jgi:hypothetical protein
MAKENCSPRWKIQKKNICAGPSWFVAHLEIGGENALLPFPPYLTGYWLVLGTFLDLSSRDFSHLELINTSHRELQAKSTGEDYNYKWPALVFSLNLVKNAFNSMKKQKLMQVNFVNYNIWPVFYLIFEFDGSKRVQMDCAGIRRIWERLGEYDRNGPVQGLISGDRGKSKL